MPCIELALRICKALYLLSKPLILSFFICDAFGNFPDTVNDNYLFREKLFNPSYVFSELEIKYKSSESLLIVS